MDQRDLTYLGSTKKDLDKLPQPVKDLFLAALETALMGSKHIDAKAYIGHGPRLFEVLEDFKGDTFRLLYSVKYKEVVFVIHVFKKKSKRGSEVPKEDRELIQQRLKRADQDYKEIYGKKRK